MTSEQNAPNSAIPAQPGKPIHLLVIEMVHHPDIVNRIAHLFSSSALIQVSFMLSKEVYALADLQGFQGTDVRIKEKNVPMRQFFKNNRDLIERSDIIFFNTIEKYFRDYFRTSFNKPMLIRIHNVNADLAPWSHLNFSKPHFFTTLSQAVRRGVFQRRFYHKKQLLKSADSLIFANSSITEYAKNLGLVKDNKICPAVLPLCFMRDDITPKTEVSGVICIAITGGIDTNRKDYESVYQAFSKSMERFTKPVHLKFLGKPKGEQGKTIVEKFEQLQTEGFRFSYNKTFIPAEEYDQQFSDVDFLIAPIRVNTNYRVFREIYGQSKMSGIENDIIANKKPALITHDYSLPEELKTVCTSYNTNEGLSLLLEKWVNQQDYIALAVQFSSLNAYQAESIIERCHTQFSNIIEHHKAAS